MYFIESDEAIARKKKSSGKKSDCKSKEKSKDNGCQK